MTPGGPQRCKKSEGRPFRSPGSLESAMQSGKRARSRASAHWSSMDTMRWPWERESRLRS